MAELYHGLFTCEGGRVLRGPDPTPSTVPCPTTGRSLRVATMDADTTAICPSCGGQGRGAFVSFDGDLRMAYACPRCRQFVWLAGA